MAAHRAVIIIRLYIDSILVPKPGVFTDIDGTESFFLKGRIHHRACHDSSQGTALLSSNSDAFDRLHWCHHHLQSTGWRRGNRSCTGSLVVPRIRLDAILDIAAYAEMHAARCCSLGHNVLRSGLTSIRYALLSLDYMVIYHPFNARRHPLRPVAAASHADI